MGVKANVIFAFATIFCATALVPLVSHGSLGWEGEQFCEERAVPELSKQVPNAVPTLRLEKPKYALGESIRFWIGVKAMNYGVIIPEKYWDTCFLYTIRPDGTVKKESVGWPVDGMLYRGWTGGWGFGKEKVQVGKYTLVFEFANKKTASVQLIVQKLDFMKQIVAKFDFQESGEISNDASIPVILKVQNRSNHKIQFPRRGVSDAYISIRVEREEPPQGAHFFYPIEKSRGSLEEDVSRISFDIYNWDVAAKVPSVILKPGEHFEQELSLEDAYQFWGPGRYEVTFSTTLALLVGKKDGKFAAYCPIRFPVVSTEDFYVREIER